MGLLEKWAHAIGWRHWIQTRVFKPVKAWKKLTAASGFDFELHRMANMDAAAFAYQHFRNAIYFSTKKELYDFVGEKLIEIPGICAEFGVFRAASLNYFARSSPSRHWHGFDSFEGLPEAWSGSGQGKGAFTLKGKLPKVEPNVTLHKGWFHQTAVPFFSAQSETLAFAHLDADLYSATKEALLAITPRIKPKSLLLFDEYFGQIAWREHEHRALEEWLNTSGIQVECLAMASNGAVLFSVKQSG